MIKKITKTSDGRYKVEFGMRVESQESPFGIGYIMPTFNVYKMLMCDTLKEAENAKYTE